MRYKKKILCTAPILRFEKVVNYLDKNSDLTVIEYCSHKKLIQIINEYDGLIPNARIKIDKQIIKNAKKLKFLYQPSMGYDHIDINYLKKKKINFNCLSLDNKFRSTLWSTAEHTMTLILSCIKSIPNLNNDVLKEGRWDNRSYFIEDLRDKTVGIIGLGNIGKKVAFLSSCFGAKIIANDPYVTSKKYKLVSLNKLCALSDIISIHVPLNSETLNLISETNFNKMKNGAYIINTSRGGVINEEDLIKALKNKKIKFSATDVLVNENINGVKKNKLVSYAKKNKNVLITPHVGGSSYEYMESIFLHAAKEIIKSLKK